MDYFNGKNSIIPTQEKQPELNKESERKREAMELVINALKETYNLLLAEKDKRLIEKDEKIEELRADKERLLKENNELKLSSGHGTKKAG